MFIKYCRLRCEKSFQRYSWGWILYKCILWPNNIIKQLFMRNVSPFSLIRLIIFSFSCCFLHCKGIFSKIIPKWIHSNMFWISYERIKLTVCSSGWIEQRNYMKSFQHWRVKVKIKNCTGIVGVKVHFIGGSIFCFYI